MIQVHMFPCLKDNYGYLVHDAEANVTAAIDTPDVPAIRRALEDKEWRLTHILNTHHHSDHAGGNLELKAQTGCQIIGPGADAGRIPGIDISVGEGDEFRLGHHRVQVFDTPGHTRGHIVYLLPDDGIAFVGDTLFSLGCGRLFEGTAAQMWSSLQKLLAWPDATLLYCAHEYTQANGQFASTLEPQNPDLAARLAEVHDSRAAGRPTVPTTLAQEKATNPFLRPTSAELKVSVGLPDAPPVEVFAKTRELKDAF